MVQGQVFTGSAKTDSLTYCSHIKGMHKGFWQLQSCEIKLAALSSFHAKF